MAYLSEGSKIGGKQIETVDGAQAKANQARDSAVDTVLRWAKDLGLGTTAKAIQNWDELEQTGFYNGENGPLGKSIVFGIHVQHTSSYGLQVVGRHNRLFIRTRENDIWSHWRELESVDKVESKLNGLKNELTSLVDDTKNQLQSNLDSHVNNKSNPHNVTKSQVGLGNVQDYGVASQAEAESGTSNSKYMTPLRTKQAIGKNAVTSLNGKRGDISLNLDDLGGIPKTNAHYVTNSGSNPFTISRTGSDKESVKFYVSDGCFEGFYENDEASSSIRWVMKNTDTENSDGSRASERVFEIQSTSSGMSVYADGNRLGTINDIQTRVDAHANRTDNPHNVTKSQVGLGSVQNYGIASQSEAEAGSTNSKYMTPLRTKQAIDTLSPVKSVNGKTGTVILSKSDVGLSAVANYGVATMEEAQAGTANNKFMTPYRTKQAIDSLSPVKSVNGKQGSISLAKEDVGIYVQYSKPSNPKVGDLWIW